MNTIRSVIPYAGKSPPARADDPEWSSADVVIESGIAIVPRLKYRFNEMKVGDSFRVPTEAARRRVSTAACNYAASHPGLKFTVRKAEFGWRCWRVT